MRLASLLSHFPEGVIARKTLGDPEADIYTIGFLTPKGGTLREDILYFGDTTLLAKATLPEAPSLVLYGSSHPELAPLPPAANVIELNRDTELFSCYNALQTCFLQDQLQFDIVRRMLLAHFSNRGLQYLIEEAAIALGNPILVVDVTYRYIAYHLGDLEAATLPLPRLSTARFRATASWMRESHTSTWKASTNRLPTPQDPWFARTPYSTQTP